MAPQNISHKPERLLKDVPALRGISTKVEQYVLLDRMMRSKIGFCTGHVPAYELPLLQFVN